MNTAEIILHCYESSAFHVFPDSFAEELHIDVFFISSAEEPNLPCCYEVLSQLQPCYVVTVFVHRAEPTQCYEGIGAELDQQLLLHSDSFGCLANSTIWHIST